MLTVNASRTDDGAVYRCSVWNRAMPEGTKLETTVALSVNCEYRVQEVRINSSLLFVRIESGNKIESKLNRTYKK